MSAWGARRTRPSGAGRQQEWRIASYSVSQSELLGDLEALLERFCTLNGQLGPDHLEGRDELVFIRRLVHLGDQVLHERLVCGRREHLGQVAGLERLDVSSELLERGLHGSFCRTVIFSHGIMSPFGCWVWPSQGTDRKSGV